MGKGSYLGPVIPFPSFHLDSTFFDGMFKNLESATEILGKLDVKRLSSTRRQGMAGVRGRAKEAARAPCPQSSPGLPSKPQPTRRRLRLGPSCFCCGRVTSRLVTACPNSVGPVHTWPGGERYPHFPGEEAEPTGVG